MSLRHGSAPTLKARFCRGEEVVVVGAGNSAGQAAPFLAGYSRRVHPVCHGPDLARSMSRHLIARLECAPAVRIHTGARVTVLRGAGQLEGVRPARTPDRAAEGLRTRAGLVMIGAGPCTDWLAGTLALDDKGFVLTGLPSGGAGDPSPVSPYGTILPGVFAVGDVCGGSVKRVASAVGEGSVVQAVHRYLAGAGRR